MPYLRQLTKIPATGRVTVKLVPAQRDALQATGLLPRKLGHLLHHAPVAKGKLEVRVTAAELDAIIAAAIKIPASGRPQQRALDVFLAYLEKQSDRFEAPPEP